MSRQIGAQGSSFEAALLDAIAQLADCEPEKVDLEVAAPGLDEVHGSVRFDLEVTADEGPAVEDEQIQDATSERDEPHREAADQRRDERDERDEEPSGISPEDLDEEAEAAADLLEGLLDAMDLPGDLRIRVKEEHAEVEIMDVGSGALIGRRGQTLEAIQELVRCALQRQFERRARVQVDVEGYRARRLEKLVEKAEEAIDAVLDSGEPERLEPMDVFERKVIHQMVAEIDGLSSRSQGREPGRRVVIEPN
jgi:spoIIIJ-associated protein